MKMKSKAYNLLQKMSQFSFEECYAGLNLLLYTDKNFKAFVERKYRLNAYKEDGEFYMTANERFFHLIGFIDAVIFLERAGILFPDHESARICNPLSEDTPEWDVLRRIITIVETGEDI